ncbi:hypothetical protein Tco_1473357, partial [Tanacetum coccineum]
MELYELVCKAEDDLRVKPDKIKKCKADEKVNDERVTGRTEGFLFEPSFRRKARLVAVMIAVHQQAQRMMRLGLHRRHEEVIVNGDAPAIASASTEGPIPPKTAEQKLARKNELKAKSTLLLAILDEHLLKFHGIKDAKTLWEAIKT